MNKKNELHTDRNPSRMFVSDVQTVTCEPLALGHCYITGVMAGAYYRLLWLRVLISNHNISQKFLFFFFYPSSQFIISLIKGSDYMCIFDAYFTKK